MWKIAPEGSPFIAGSIVIALIVFVLTKNWSVVLPIVLVLFMLFFFRDPDRRTPQDKDVFVSPADGKVIVIRDVDEAPCLKKRAKQISIFMSPFNVHVNRSPVDGKVVDVIHTKGSYKAAYRDAAALANENTVMVLDTAYGNVVVRQVAGFIARRIVCRVNPGDELERGDRYGIIKFSSRVDIFLPEDVVIDISLNERVNAGKTIVAHMKR